MRDEYLHKSIYGIIFFGCPHRGLEITALKSIVQGKTTENLINDLKKNSKLLIILYRRFAQVYQHIELISIREANQTHSVQEARS